MLLWFSKPSLTSRTADLHRDPRCKHTRLNWDESLATIGGLLEEMALVNAIKPI